MTQAEVKPYLNWWDSYAWIPLLKMIPAGKHKLHKKKQNYRNLMKNSYIKTKTW